MGCIDTPAESGRLQYRFVKAGAEQIAKPTLVVGILSSWGGNDEYEEFRYSFPHFFHFRIRFWNDGKSQKWSECPGDVQPGHQSLDQ